MNFNTAIKIDDNLYTKSGIWINSSRMRGTFKSMNSHISFNV